MALFKKNKQENNSFELGKNNLSELPPLPDDNFNEEDLEEIDEEELNNEEEELEDLEEIEDEEVPKPDYSKLKQKSNTRPIQNQVKKVTEKPVQKQNKVKEEIEEPVKKENFNEQILNYIIELRDYSIKLEEVLSSQQARIVNYQERLNALESFAFRVKSS